MDFFFHKSFQEIISLSIVLCLFIHNIGSKHDRETMLLTYTRITSAKDFGELIFGHFSIRGL